MLTMFTGPSAWLTHVSAPGFICPIQPGALDTVPTSTTSVLSRFRTFSRSLSHIPSRGIRSSPSLRSHGLERPGIGMARMGLKTRVSRLTEGDFVAISSPGDADLPAWEWGGSVASQPRPHPASGGLRDIKLGAWSQPPPWSVQGHGVLRALRPSWLPSGSGQSMVHFPSV